MRTVSVALALTLFAFHNLAAQQVSPHARNAVTAIQQLRLIGVPNSNELENGPPSYVPGLLRRLNQELKALIVDDLNDTSKHAVPDEDEILDQLRAAGWDEISSNKWNAFGEIREIKFDWKTGYDPGILIVSTKLWLPCGKTDPDSAVYVFQGMARHWDLVLTADSDFDPAGADDTSGVQYEISPPDSRGRWYFVVAHLPPSCRDLPRVLHYQAFRPGASPDKPVVLFSGRDKIDLHFVPPFRLNVETDWFAITAGRPRKLDAAPAVFISSYQVTGSQAQRMAPLALTPEDFLDQWVQLSWDDARRWARPSSDSALQEWHAKLHGLATDSVDIESVHHCSGEGEGDQIWLVELAIDRQANPSITQEELYVQIAKRDGLFTVESANSIHPAGCPGKTPLMPQTDWSLPGW